MAVRWLLDRSQAAGRLVTLHQACAAVARDPGRKGLHLLAAGDEVAALPLLAAAHRAATAGTAWERRLGQALRRARWLTGRA